EEHVATGRRPGQSYGHTGPLRAFGDFALDADLDPAQELLHDLRRDHQLFRLPFRQTARLLAADRANRAFQVADAGFPRVVPDDVSNRLFRKFNLLCSGAVLFFLPPTEVLQGDVWFLSRGGSLQLDDLRAVAQALRNRIEHVRRGDNEPLRQIEGYVQVVIPECRVLSRIERFEECRSGNTTKIAPALVNFVGHE